MSGITFSNQAFRKNLTAFFIVAVIIFACALIGIFGRPLFFLAIFWPANAVLLGLFLRFQNLNNFGGWVGAFTAFMTADLITGNYFLLTLFLTFANLLHVIVTLVLIHLFKLDYKQYNRGLTFLYLFVMSAFGGCLAAPVFACLTVPYLPNTFMSMDRIWIDFGMWWTGEILNVITFLPILLAIPEKRFLKNILKNISKNQFNIKPYSHLQPLLFLSS